MTDEIDMANDRAEQFTEDAIRRAGYGVVLPQGYAGDCELCGHWSGRLIDGNCAPCRDRYGLP